MPTCPDTCPVVRAQILKEQEALKSAAKEPNKDTVPKRPQPINESRSGDSRTRANAESVKLKSSPQTQQMNDNITQQNLSTPGRSSDKKYQSRHVQQDMENLSTTDRSSDKKYQSRHVQQDIEHLSTAGKISDKKYQSRHVQQDMQSEEENISARSASTASRKKRREDEQEVSHKATYREDKSDESSTKNIQGRSKAAAGTASRARQHEDINTMKRSDREFQSKSGASSRRETEEEAGPSSGGSSIPQGHSPCSPKCPLKRYKELIKRRTEEKQRQLDRYLIRKGFNYFDNLCTCSVICLFNQLSRDPFVRSLIQSALLFTVGLKLCSELYSWQIPSRANFY